MHAHMNKTLMFKITAIHRTIHSGQEGNLQDAITRLDIRQCHLSLMEIIKVPTTIIKPIIGHPKGNLDQRLSHYLSNVGHNIEADHLAPILSERTKLRYEIRKDAYRSSLRNLDSQA